jgi:hypothetical protein
MARRHSRPAQGLTRAFPQGANLWSRNSEPAVRTLVTDRDVRQHSADETALTHRPKNGVYDPITFYHMADLIAQLSPEVEFRSAELLPILAAHKPQLVWDATTVGRVMADMAESLADAYEVRPIRTHRQWDGMRYVISSHPVARAGLVRLVKDLRRLAEQVVEEELAGQPPKRTETPLLSCPSLG